LRARLAQVVEVPFVSKEFVLDLDDIVEITELWPKLSEEFARSIPLQWGPVDFGHIRSA
jgi:hypothetical protein